MNGFSSSEEDIDEGIKYTRKKEIKKVKNMIEEEKIE